MDVEEDFKDFLRDMYPGVEKAPTQMVQMMASPKIEPDDKVESSALFHNENIETCGVADSECPDSFFRPAEGAKCIHRSRQEMEISEAANYCSNLGSGSTLQLLQLELLQDTQFLSEYFLKGVKGRYSSNNNPVSFYSLIKINLPFKDNINKISY